MANRVTDADVKQIIALNVLTDTTVFIDTAHLLVDEYLSTKGISEALLTQIEKYLSAHLVALHNDERQLTEQELGDATDTYTGTFGKGLDSTQYGQTVKMLDPTGIFAGISDAKYVSLDVITIDNE